MPGISKEKQVMLKRRMSAADARIANQSREFIST